jgi:signal transduction histidine kinase
MTASIRTKLLALFAGLAVVPMVVVGLAAYGNSLAAVEDLVRQRAFDAAGRAASDLAGDLRPRRTETTLLVRNREIQDLYAAHLTDDAKALDTARTRAETFLRQFLRGPRHVYLELRYTDARGQTVATVSRPAAASTRGGYQVRFGDAGEPAAAAADQPNGLSETVAWPPATAPVLRLSRRVVSVDTGQRLGYLEADIDVESLIADTRLSGDTDVDDYLTLYDPATDRFLHHPERARVTQHIGDLLSGLEALDIDTTPDANDGGTHSHATDADDWILTWRTPAGAPWSVVAVTRLSAFSGPVQDAGRLNLGITGGAILLAIVLLPFTVGRITGAIQRVTAGAEAIAGGDLEQRIDVIRGDETGVLAGAFNRMADSLRTSLGELRALTAELEDRVRRRTADLEQANQQLQSRNRDLEVERALEGVRTVIAAMQESSDLAIVLRKIRDSLIELDVEFLWSGINIFDFEKGLMHCTFAMDDAVTSTLRLEDLTFPAFSAYMEHWKRQETYLHTYPTPDAVAYLNDMGDVPGFDESLRATLGVSITELVPRARAAGGLTEIDVQFAQGSLYVSRMGPDSFSGEDATLVERFTEVFALGYRRHLDLLQAEQRARQAELEAAAERVRAEAMDMRSADDIRRVVGVVRRELIGLGLDEHRGTVINFLDVEHPDRLYAYFAIPNPKLFDCSWTSPDLWTLDERTAAALFTYEGQGGFVRQSIEQGRIDRIDHAAAGLIGSRFVHDFGVDPDYLDHFQVGPRLTAIPFTHGQIGVRGDDFLTDEQIDVVRALCDALSLGFTRFQDFQQLEQASANKSQFLRRMSHDLRSPMNAIIGYTRLVLRRARALLDERQVRNLENIETSSHNLLNLINDILDLSRIEAGRIEVNLQDINPCTLANECADALESIVKESVVLRRDLADVGSINSDVDRLRQVVMNLLGNATKFTESGSITLSLKRVDEDVELCVADTGIGIPADDLPHIFDEFRQVERQGGEGAEGTGLGLAIARKTVDLLGGHISATSEVGVGTTFTVRLPA